MGARLRNPELVDTLERIAEEGADAFYSISLPRRAYTADPAGGIAGEMI